MIWKKRRLLICLFALFAVFFSISFSSSHASALDWVINPSFDRVKLVRTSGSNTIQYLTNEGTGTIPWTLLGNNQNNSFARNVWGFIIYEGLGQYNYSYQKYTSITVDLTVSNSRSNTMLGAPGSDYRSAMSLIIYDTNSNQREVGCSIIEESWDSSPFLKYRCSANFQENAVPQGFHVKMYPVDNVDNLIPNFVIPAYTNDDLKISYFGFQIKTDRDASDALLEEQLSISRGIQNSIDSLNTSFNSYFNYQSNQDAQDRSDVQDASDDATADGNNASGGAQQATSSILGVIGSIYGVLLNPHQTNCVINGIQIYQMNLGNLDFCTGFDIPQSIFAIGSLILIGIIILLGWSILRAGMSLYNELLGGKD